MLLLKEILCPVAFDPNSLIALRVAAELVQGTKATLRLLHVIEIPAAPEVALPFGQMENAARARLEKLARQSLMKQRYESLVTIGDAGMEILHQAKLMGADLIVMATHGRKGVRRLVLGSVAERVVREAPCPVLTVSPKAAPVRRAKSPRRGRGG